VNRPGVPRALLVSGSSAALIIGLLVGMTGTTLGADTRDVYFGDPADLVNGEGRIVTTPVTAGGVFVFDVTARNRGNQTLAHAVLAFGSDVAARPGWDVTAQPSLPAGAAILDASLDGTPCSFDADGAACDVGSLGGGGAVTATFIVQAPTSPVATSLWATFKVAESPNDQGDNVNTFYADGDVTVGPTNSNGRSTFLLGNETLKLSTAGLTFVPGDPQQTTVEVPGAFGGLVSITELDGPTGCSPKCIGQTVQANVRAGALLTPYLRWTLVINRSDVTPNKGGVIHTLDNGTVVTIANTKANACGTKKPTNCIESFVVSKKTNTTTIVFRTPTNGAVRGFG
jgi:hypothetical protein